MVNFIASCSLSSILEVGQVSYLLLYILSDDKTPKNPLEVWVSFDNVSFVVYNVSKQLGNCTFKRICNILLAGYKCCL